LLCYARGWHLSTGSGPLDIIFRYILRGLYPGRGLDYPHSNLQGFAVCFDVRPAYRAALPADEALEIIKSQAGQHFDPDVIDVFLQLNIPELSPSTADLGLAV
jgi:hypothetical protein